MELKGINKIKDGRYIKNYELTYTNKVGRDKVYEIISRSELVTPDDLGKKVNGISIVAFKDGKMLLLREFRMGVNQYVYNLCAGMIEPGESVEQCVNRELYEETGLRVKKIITILPACYSAVAISDIKTHIVYVEAMGEIEDHTSDNEDINAAFYSRAKVRELISKEVFSARAQVAAFGYANMSEEGLIEFIKNGYVS